MGIHFSFLSHTFHSHDPLLVMLSVSLAVIASYVSLEFAGKTRISLGSKRRHWGALAALTLGGGIWSMHFIAITALRLPFKPIYDVPLTLFSLLIAIAFSGIGLYLVFWGKQTWKPLALGGTIMGHGVAAMHYSGMAAVALPVATTYDAPLVALSIIIAIIASTAALWLAANVRRRSSRILSAFAMAAAISGMHFVGMAALNIGTAPIEQITLSGVHTSGVTVGIGLTTLGLLLAGLLLWYVNYVSRKLNRTALQEFALSAMAAKSFRDASASALQAMRDVLRVETAVVKLFDLRMETATRLISTHEEKLRVEHVSITSIAPESPYKAVMERRSTFKISGNDYPQERAPSSYWEDSALRSGILVPASRNKDAVTVVAAFSAHRREFTDDDELFLRKLADMLTLISDRDRAIEELRLREHALESIAQGITISDVTGAQEVITYANPAFSRMVGYPSEEIIGASPSRFFVSEGSENIRAQIALAKAKKRAIQIEVPTQRKDGTTFIDQVNESPMINEQGELTHTVIVHEDLTKVKARDQKINELQRLETVGQLTGGVAHDFNNLLTVIKANAEDLRHELKDSKDLGFQASMILEAADRGADLVRQLMAFSRKQELAPEAVDLNAMIDVIASLARRTFPATIEIVTKKGDKLPVVHADRGQLQTALLNVAVNARDAMEQGGTLTIETTNAELDHDYAKENLTVLAGSYVLISISDTGVGMEAGVLKRAFDPFFTTKEVGKGTGLGLSMVYGFVRQSGGHVKIYSEPFIGTTVKIYLPAIRAIHTPPTPQPELATKQTDAGRILLVEDDPLVRKSVHSKLLRMGHDVLAVASAMEAIAALETMSFALVFSDVIMPGAMNGADLVREVGRRWPDVRVLLTSGYTEAAVLGKVKIPDGVRVLSKPYTNDALSEALSGLLAAWKKDEAEPHAEGKSRQGLA